MTRNRVKATTTCFLKHNLRKVKNAFAPTRIIEQSQIGVRVARSYDIPAIDLDYFESEQ